MEEERGSWPPGPEQDPGGAPEAGRTGEGDEISRRLAARQVRAGLDAQVLAQAPFLDKALTQLAAAVSDLLDARWATLGADQVAAAARALRRERARLDAAMLRSVKAVDDRDDIVPKARPGTAGATFLRHAAGVDPRQAQRDAETARLVDPDTGDLATLGAAYAAGDLTRAHVDVVVGSYRRLGAAVRDSLVPVVDPATGEESERPCVEVVDAILARQARALIVPELRRAADRLVENLSPPSPDGAHERRYLHLGLLPDGSLIGRFTCGPAQALVLTTAVAAGSAPRPGTAVDADGVEHVLRDCRTSGQRRIDALIDAIGTGTATTSTRAVAGTGTTGTDPDGLLVGDEPLDGAALTPDPGPVPEPEGEHQVRRPPGVRGGPFPQVEIVVIATLDQLTDALAQGGDCGDERSSPSIGCGTAPPGSFDRAAGFARAQHGGAVHPSTLALLACSGRLRPVLRDAPGAVLNLGRTQRLASPAQKRALLARDMGCVIPGCVVPGGECDVHHPHPWADGGLTDLTNLALVCPRHHTEVHERGTWQIQMIDGVPWVRPPEWVHPGRLLLRNTTHQWPAA